LTTGAQTDTLKLQHQHYLLYTLQASRGRDPLALEGAGFDFSFLRRRDGPNGRRGEGGGPGIAGNHLRWGENRREKQRCPGGYRVTSRQGPGGSFFSSFFFLFALKPPFHSQLRGQIEIRLTSKRRACPSRTNRDEATSNAVRGSLSTRGPCGSPAL
jgi:hypothetical protein